MPHKITEYLKVDVTDTSAILMVAIEKIYPIAKKKAEMNKIKISFKVK